MFFNYQLINNKHIKLVNDVLQLLEKEYNFKN